MSTSPTTRERVHRAMRAAGKMCIGPFGQCAFTDDHDGNLCASLCDALVAEFEATALVTCTWCGTDVRASDPHACRLETLLDPKVTKLALENGSLEMTVDGKGMVKVFAHAFWNLLTESKAENYVTMTLERGEREIEVIVQKRAKKTAHELRREAEAERDEASGHIRNLADRTAPEGSASARALLWLDDLDARRGR